MNETTENFLKVMASFEWPEPQPVSYRLYYNDDGSPKCYTMEDKPGKYINVDCETYALRAWNVKVIDDKLHTIAPKIFVSKLAPTTESGTCCSPSNICVVVSPDQPHIRWKMITNETH